jgi:RHS repeat-associated protein
LVSTSGLLANTYTYDPYGTTVDATGTAYNPYQYTGTYLDAATGLYQMGARYYQPGSGRFTQLDPLPTSVFEGQRYTYTPADPVNYSDPTGLHHVCRGAHYTVTMPWGYRRYLSTCQVDALYYNASYIGYTFLSIGAVVAVVCGFCWVGAGVFFLGGVLYIAAGALKATDARGGYRGIRIDVYQYYGWTYWASLTPQYY